MTNTVLSRTACPNCGIKDYNGDNLISYSNGSSHCYACDYHVSGTVHSSKSSASSNDELQKGEVTSIPHRNIKLGTCEKYGIERIMHRGVGATIFPFGKAQKIIDDNKKIEWRNYRQAIFPLGVKSFDPHIKRLLITEGEFDALAVSQVIGDWANVTSLMNGSSSVSTFLDQIKDVIKQHDEIVICFDNDEPGKDAAKDAVDLLAFNKKVRVVDLPLKDANDMLMAGLDKELATCIKESKYERPNGVISIGELPLSFFNQKEEPAIKTMFPELNYFLRGGLPRGQLTMLSGGTGVGKSTFVTNIIFDWMLNNDMKIADIKLEEAQKMSVFTYLAMYYNIDRNVLLEKPELLTEEQKLEFQSKFKNLMSHDHFGSLASNKLLSLLEYYATVEKVDYIFLDHISIAIAGNQSSRDGERKDIDMLVVKLRELINKTGVGIVCLCHLRNPDTNSGENQTWEEGKVITRYSLRGSGMLAGTSDNLIGIEGNLKDPIEKNLRKVRLVKTRYGKEQEVLCDVYELDKVTNKIRVKG